jgi:A/G-specific adenine glycosylase
MNTQEFNEWVWEKGRELFRPMPWREDTQPYFVLVSELMLQQTQVERVIPKFTDFIARFPTIEALAESELSEVLTAWSGLGYNRRAKFLHSAAKMVANELKGKFPSTVEGLVRLPGVGVNTAGALMAYSFNAPVTFIETNVRTVYFHHFFDDQETVSDAELRELVAATVDTEHPREWYWALMDYGTYLKRNGVRLNAKSRHYKRQTPLKGSLREVRGIILKKLAQAPLSLADLTTEFEGDTRLEPALEGLLKEGLVSQHHDELRLGV